MTRKDFLHSLDRLLELPRGTLEGPENLDKLEQWNSLAIITFIALADTNNRVNLSPRQLMACTTVSDLLRVAQVESGD
jgi:acyl carrier protein